MRNGTPGFQGARLVQARDARGLSQVALAELIGRTSSSISRWEKNRQSPEPDALQDLARAVNLPVSFFLRPPSEHGNGPMYARSMATVTQAARKRAEVRLRWAQEISVELQRWVDLPALDVPRLEVGDYRELREEDIERAAHECRMHWKLGAGPIADLLAVVESAGVVAVKDETGSASLDGLSNWSALDGRPYMLVATDKATCVRTRMDAAHELGHIVLHRNLTDRCMSNASAFREIERQAFRFAGAFLMPAESFADEVWSPSLNAFCALKDRWRVSVAAMIMRCVALDVVSSEYQRRLWKSYSARGWRKGEPLDDRLTVESPRLLQRSVRLLLDEGVRNHESLLAEFRLSSVDVESLCALPRGFMTNDERCADVVTMPTLKRDSKDGRVGGDRGTVLSFPRS
jgi:Zn-dependent peptidase ImmA (M78 family)/transcriptional regulator with XRE-family HTH domain